MITPRLQKIIDLVDKENIADIGTDHAYIPIRLASLGRIKSAIATDKNKGPLEIAKKNIEKYEFSDIIKTRLGGGLEPIEAGECELVIIAGMGGDLIARILSDSPWVKDEKYELILQPMTAVEDLREYLLKNGFEIKLEQAVKSQGRIYTVMKVKFTGKITDCSPLFYFFGKLIDNIGEDELVYINRKRRIISDLAEEIKDIESQRLKYQRLVEALNGIDGLLGK